VIPLRDDIPGGRVPLVTCSLIAINLAAFFGWQLRFEDLGVLRGGAIPYELLTFQDTYPRDLVPPPLTIFTSMFLHGGLLHLGGNMLFLWIFGNNVEDALGRRRFLAFYLLSGVAAALVQTLACAVMAAGLPAAEAGQQLSAPMVGASGAIAGVLAAYLVLFPRARVSTLFIFIIFFKVISVPAALFIGLWFAGQLLAVWFGGTPGVATFAHVGGFLAGLGLVWRMGRRPGWQRTARRWSYQG
jgi:membrane associated rhomboid family serine protease